ncbi:PAP2 domain protein [Striga asiatica]|uniref:PAP2 domain protein n=1 Tax=Striga asiatica TaxID=4170 RepID=A0A5A7QBR0_STRAF|nr:PAP2 domain protein [Striga asiatica]
MTPATTVAQIARPNCSRAEFSFSDADPAFRSDLHRRPQSPSILEFHSRPSVVEGPIVAPPLATAEVDVAWAADKEKNGRKIFEWVGKIVSRLKARLEYVDRLLAEAGEDGRGGSMALTAMDVCKTLGISWVLRRIQEGSL